MQKPKPDKMKQSRPGAYWLYGAHAVLSALENPQRVVHRVVATRNAMPKLEGKLAARHPKPEEAEARVFERLLPEGAVHQGLAIEVGALAQPHLSELLADAPAGPLLLLDQVSDPHNVGAILRSAAAFDVAAVIVTQHGAPLEGAVMAKAASGALELVPLVTVVNLSQAMEEIKKAGYWVAGLDGEAPQAIHQAKLDAKTALVLGAEGKGLRRLTAERCDLLVKLPISARMESLNVSNAAAVALYELSRARLA